MSAKDKVLEDLKGIPDASFVEGTVSESYSGRRELFFSKQKDLLAKFKDGQRVTIVIVPME